MKLCICIVEFLFLARPYHRERDADGAVHESTAFVVKKKRKHTHSSHLHNVIIVKKKIQRKRHIELLLHEENHKCFPKYIKYGFFKNSPRFGIQYNTHTRRKKGEDIAGDNK